MDSVPAGCFGNRILGVPNVPCAENIASPETIVFGGVLNDELCAVKFDALWPVFCNRCVSHRMGYETLGLRDTTDVSSSE